MTHPWHPIPGGVTAPFGFLAAGITAGLKPSGNPDLSLLLAPEGAVCAGTFTTSLVRAACVDLCAERLQTAPFGELHRGLLELAAPQVQRVLGRIAQEIGPPVPRAARG